MKKNSTTRRHPRASSRTKPSAATTSLLRELRRNSLFKGVPRQVVADTASGFRVRTFAAGDVIFDEFSQERALYLICSGRVRMKKYTKFGVESLLSVLHAGDFFGELSLVDGLPRAAHAEAMDACQIASLDSVRFRRLVRTNHAIALNILLHMALRLRTMDQHFVLELGRNALSARTKVDRLNLLIEAGHRLHGSLDVTVVVDTIAEVAARSLSAEFGILFLVDAPSGSLRGRIPSAGSVREHTFSRGESMAGRVAQTGEAVLVNDSSGETTWPWDQSSLDGIAVQSVLCAPMRDGEGKIAGVYCLLNKRTGQFGPEDEAFLEALSVDASLALENARQSSGKT